MNWDDILINMGVSVLLTAIKNENRRKQLRSVFLKIFRVTWLNFSSDAEFQSVVSQNLQALTSSSSTNS